MLEHSRALLDAYGEITKQIADCNAGAVLAVYLGVGRGGQLALDGLGMVDCEGAVRAVLVVVRGEGQQRDGSKGGEEGAVAAEEGLAGFMLGGACGRQWRCIVQ